jgi:hypothetical protein
MPLQLIRTGKPAASPGLAGRRRHDEHASRADGARVLRPEHAGASILDPAVLAELASEVGSPRFVVGLPTRDGVIVAAHPDDLVAARRRTAELHAAAEPGQQLQRGVLIVDRGQVVDAVESMPAPRAIGATWAEIALAVALWTEIVAAIRLLVVIE